MTGSTLLVLVLVAALAGVVGFLLGSRRAPVAPTTIDPGQLELARDATSQAVAPVKDSLDRFDRRLQALEDARIEAHGQLREQVAGMRLTNESLRRETAALATALRRPQVRGSWGELHLKRTVELAGMVERCDFDLQVSTRSEDSLLRPDMVVHLAGDKSVVVDSKVPLDAYLDLVEAEDADEQAHHLGRHVKQVRHHVDQLSAKQYWAQFDTAPEFVVLFLPGEAFLSAALESDPTLLEYAANKKIVLATPTTLIALLRTIAHAWTQEQLAHDARAILEAGRELHVRVGTVATHLDKLGAALEKAMKSFNDTVASIESRVLPSARRLGTLTVADAEVVSPRIGEATPRTMTAPELTDELPS